MTHDQISSEDVLRTLAAALLMLERVPDLTGLPEQQREMARDMLARVRDRVGVLAGADAGDLRTRLGAAISEGRQQAATDIEQMDSELGDTGWRHLEDKATEADYPVEWVRRRRTRNDFTTATIEVAYQYGYRTAAKVARGGAA